MARRRSSDRRTSFRDAVESFETMTLFTQLSRFQRVSHAVARIYPINLVVEIDSANPVLPTVKLERYPYNALGGMGYADLRLPADQAKRFHDFFRRTMTFDFDAVWYECHSLAPYVHGVEEDILASPKQIVEKFVGPPIRRRSIRSGRAYAIQDAEGKITHSFLGVDPFDTDLPPRTVSILDGNGPMAVLPVEALCEIYGGQIIRPIIYGQIGAEALRADNSIQ